MWGVVPFDSGQDDVWLEALRLFQDLTVPFSRCVFFWKFQVENLEAFKSHILVGFNGKLLVTFGG